VAVHTFGPRSALPQYKRILKLTSDAKLGEHGRRSPPTPGTLGQQGRGGGAYPPSCPQSPGT